MKVSWRAGAAAFAVLVVLFVVKENAHRMTTPVEERMVGEVISEDVGFGVGSKMQPLSAGDAKFAELGLRKDRVIMLSLNEGFFDFFLNWFWYFKRTGIEDVPVVVFAEDNLAKEKLDALNEKQIFVLRSYLAEEGGAEKSLDYNTASYKKMVSERPSLILDYLRKNIDVLYTDTDVVWLKDPFPFLEKLEAEGGFDLLAPSDGIRNNHTYYCTGFLWLKSNERVIDLIESWEEALKEKPQHNQPIFHEKLLESQVKDGKLSSNYFSNGISIYRKDVAEHLEDVIVFHNNYIISHEKKKEKFKSLGYWKVDENS